MQTLAMELRVRCAFVSFLYIKSEVKLICVQFNVNDRRTQVTMLQLAINYVCLSFHPFLLPSVKFVFLSIHPSVSQSSLLSVYPSVKFVFLSIHSSSHQPSFLSAYPPLLPSVKLTFCRSIPSSMARRRRRAKRSWATMGYGYNVGTMTN